MTPTSDVYATHFVVRSFCDLRGTFGSEIVSTLGKAAAKGMRVSEPSKAEPGTELIEKLACCVAAIRKLAATVAAAAYTHCTNLCGCTYHPFIRYMSRWTQIMYVMICNNHNDNRCLRWCFIHARWRSLLEIPPPPSSLILSKISSILSQTAK